MAYLPQFVTVPTPAGFQDEDFHYSFDQSNTPLLGVVTPGQEALRLTLQLQSDCEFHLRGFQISGNTASLQIRVYDCYGNELSSTLIECDRAYSATENGAAPIGRLPVVVEPELICPPGGFLSLDLAVL